MPKMMIYTGITMDEIVTFETVGSVIVALSCVGSLSILLTGFMFPNLVRNKIYMKMIMAMSLSDFLGNILCVFGYPPDHTILCHTQGAMLMTFYRVFWMYDVFLTYTLHQQIVTNRIPLHYATINYIVVGINLILFTVPYWFGLQYGTCYSTSTYGTVDVGDHPTESELSLYNGLLVALLFAPLLVCLLFQIALVGHLKWKVIPSLAATLQSLTSGGTDNLRSKRAQELSKRIDKCVSNVIWYPMICVVTWLPNLVTYMVLRVIHSKDPNNGTHYLLVTTTSQLATSGGFFMAVAFFYKSKESRHLWMQLMRRVLGSSSSSSSRESNSIRGLSEVSRVTDVSAKSQLSDKNNTLRKSYGNSKTTLTVNDSENKETSSVGVALAMGAAALDLTVDGDVDDDYHDFSDDEDENDLASVLHNAKDNNAILEGRSVLNDL